MEMKNQQESVNDLLGAKDNIESSNKSVKQIKILINF